MKALRGIVVGTCTEGLRVRLQSRRIVTAPHTRGVRRWDSVLVFWDYRHDRVASVERRNPQAELSEQPPEPRSPDNVGDEPPAGDYEVDLSGSGALCPLGVESGDSGFWELVLSDGSLAAAGVM